MNYYIEAFKKYALFTGRATRKEYWMFTIINLIIGVIIWMIGSIINFSTLDYLYTLAFLLPQISITVRRLHDTGRSGWWILISLVPFLGILVLTVFVALKGQASSNQYDLIKAGTSEIKNNRSLSYPRKGIVISVGLYALSTILLIPFGYIGTGWTPFPLWAVPTFFGSTPIYSLLRTFGFITAYPKGLFYWVFFIIVSIITYALIGALLGLIYKKVFKRGLVS